MYFIFDTETSGLPKKRMANYKDTDAYSTCRIVSIAWVVLGTDLEQVSRGTFLVKPKDFIIPESATAIHGITNEEAYNNGYSMTDVVQVLRDDLLKCTHLVAHNISFDFGVLLHECHRIKDVVLVDYLFKMTRECTMQLGKKQLGLKKMPRLAELYSALFNGKELVGAHNAVVDTDCCVECYCALKTSVAESPIVTTDADDSATLANKPETVNENPHCFNF